ncbi:MAG: VWA domain-containing protein, partial [Cyclobacteriaceae bacterium]
MKRPLLILILLLVVFCRAKAQEGEAALEKGQLLKNKVYPAHSGYVQPEVIHDLSTSEWDNNNGFDLSSSNGLFTTGAYGNNRSYFISSDEVQLPALMNKRQRINLYISEAFSLESYHDEGIVQVSADGGQTWEVASIRSGQSENRTSVINLSEYAGKSIKIGFKLETDDSFNSEGWTVHQAQVKTEFLKGNSGKGQAKKSTVNSRDPNTLYGNLSSLDAQKFPRFIFANLSVDLGNNALNTLDESNFSIVETIKDSVDDVRNVFKDSTFRVYPPLSENVSKPVDIVFLMDNSGSMGQELDSVSTNVKRFVDSLEARGLDYRLALCRFGQSANSGDPIYVNNAGWYTDAASFKNMWDTENVASGGAEPSWDAMYYSTQQYSFATAAQKVFIHITDEAITGNNYRYSNINDKQLVIDQLQNVGVTLYTLVPTNQTVFQDDFGAIADSTGGRLYDIYSPFVDILDDIGEDISNTYTVRYLPTKPIFDGLEREVAITVDYGTSPSLVLNGSYTPGSAPAIYRSDATLALHKQAQQEGLNVSIEVNVEDRIAPYTQTVSLYYKNVGSDTYIEIPMSSTVSGTSFSTWEATIPAADVLRQGIEYYVRASDGQVTTTAPEFINREGYPWSFAVLPNLPPSVINKTTIASAKQGDNITFEVEAIDNTTSLANVWLYLKNANDITYQVYPMTAAGSNLYTYSHILQGGLTEYFFVAEDNFGVSAQDGDEHNPFLITTNAPWIAISSPVRHRINVAGFDFSTFTLWSIDAKIEDDGLSIGDYIGVFYPVTTCDGQGNCVTVEKCGGYYAWNGQPSGGGSFIINGDDTNTAEKDGFVTGDSLIFKVFDASESQVLDADYTVRGGTYTFAPNGSSDIATLRAYVKQQTVLEKSLNLWSTYLDPKNNSFNA